MPRIMKSAALLSGVLTVITTILYHTYGYGLSLAITFGTTAYHFGMRLLVGAIFDQIMGNRVDYHKPWFRPLPWEAEVYDFLRVKKWKGRMPTYAPEQFSLKLHTPEEIVRAMCQSELVHETNVLLSFLPLGASVFWGAFWVFLVTSILAAGADLLFVIMQRYNRPRVIALLHRKRN